MLNYEFPPLGGGAGNAFFYLIKEFSHYPCLHIDAVAASEGEYKEKVFSPGIKVYLLNIGKKNQKLHYQGIGDLLIYTIKSYFFCRRLLRRHSYDLCHAFLGVPCGLVAMMLNLPYIVSLRGSDVPFYNPRFLWLDRLFLQWLSRIIWKRAEKVIANSQGLKQLATKVFSGEKIEVINNGVDTVFFSPEPSKSKQEKKRLHLLCVSRLIKRKGIEYLIKAVAKLKGKVELTIVGEGKEERNLKRLALTLGVSLYVKFKGRVPHHTLKEIYQNSDLFVLPSLNEGMSNAVLEAMACGLPLILTSTGGTAELLSGNGYVVRKKDVQSLVDKLKRFLANKELLVLMGQKSREIALKMSWSDVAQNYYQIYNAVLNCASANRSFKERRG